MLLNYIVALIGGVLALTFSTSATCVRFQDISARNYYSCDENCMQKQTGGTVSGTLQYSEESDVCLAGLHAGALNMSGGNVFIEKKKIEKKFIHGTCRNRICSNDTEADVVYEVKETENIINKNVSGDVVLVHNSYKGGQLDLLCLTEDEATHYKNTIIKSYKYETLRRDAGEVKGPKKVFLTHDAKSNRHAFHCTGRSAATDVFAPVNFRSGEVKVTQSTWRASKGDNLEIKLTKSSSYPEEGIRRFPGSNKNNNKLTLQMTDVNSEDSGLYLLGDNTKGAYYNVIIRDCEAGRYGNECQHDCPGCKNDGQCHSYTGECLCPPGFIGRLCQHACPEGRFGTKCQFQCNKKTLLFSNEDVSCKDLTFCLPAPLGCICPPGYRGSFCSQECEAGRFGAGCTERCQTKCQDSDCDRFTGTCLHDATPMVNNLKLEATAPGELTISYQADSSDDTSLSFFISYKLLEIIGCPPETDEDGDWEMIVEEDRSVVIQGLEDYASYNVCVIVSHQGKGHSNPQCINTTTVSQPPTLNVTDIGCIDETGNRIRCTAIIEGNCTHYNGPMTQLKFSLSTDLECKNKSLGREGVESLESSESFVIHDFEDVFGGLVYKPSVVITNDAGDGQKRDDIAIVETPARNPPPVEDLQVAVLGDGKVRFMWNDPCPSNGAITGYRIFVSSSKYKDESPDTKCPNNVAFDRCSEIQGLTAGETYSDAGVMVWGQKRWGTYYYSSEISEIEFTLSLQRPSQPILKMKGRDSRSLNLAILTPSQPGGRLVNCTLKRVGSEDSCDKDYEDDVPMICQISNLMSGKIYDFEASCCNREYCGEILHKKIATEVQPKFQGEASVGRITNSTITVSLPKITNQGDGNSTIAIVVEELEEGGVSVEDLQKITIEMLANTESKGQRNDEQPQGTRRSKRNTEQSSQCKEMVKITGVVSADTSDFVVGDSKTYGGFYNCPLKYKASYALGFLATTDLLGKKTYTWQVIKEPVTVIPSPGDSSYITILIVCLLVIVVLIIIIIIFVVYLYKHRTKRKNLRAQSSNDGNRNSFQMREFTPGQEAHQRLCPAPLAIAPGKPAIPGDPIYENIALDEPICGNKNGRIPRVEVENYLNQIIKSEKAISEFKSVPDNMKKISIGLQPINRRKNRFLDNMPYDETRVKLSIINNDPSSDYINASHIQGYGDKMRYIATQGPKEVDVPTITDFWRMVVEQKVSAIIMVANFVEEGKVKVGQYLKLDGTLTFGSYSIKVLSYKNLPYFTVSTVQVFVDGDYHQEVLHYHYKNWPDHGVPDEPYTLASMIRLFQQRHTKGGVVVHCSAGTGRTGTVLMVLLYHDMLMIQGSLDSLEVLQRLRESRGCLIENALQYNLGLEVIDEVFFGKSTEISPRELQDRLDTLIERSPSLYMQAKTLASPLTYRNASNPSIQHLNRNLNILPADSSMEYLSKVNKQENSLYVNAVKISFGQMRKKLMITTEHPVVEAMDRFWRLIAEKRCHSVILINHYTAERKGLFPSLIPKEGHEMTIAGYTIVSQGAQPYEPNILQYTVTITDMQEEIHEIPVYQVLTWANGCIVPENPEIILTLATMLLQTTKLPNSGPPLLCCGDGVTGCGLVAGMTLLLERINNEQIVDVYRTVVKLLKSRHEFITCHEQFSMLYKLASLYFEQFATYANFK